MISLYQQRVESTRWHEHNNSGTQSTEQNFSKHDTAVWYFESIENRALLKLTVLKHKK